MTAGPGSPVPRPPPPAGPPGSGAPGSGEPPAGPPSSPPRSGPRLGGPSSGPPAGPPRPEAPPPVPPPAQPSVWQRTPLWLRLISALLLLTAVALALTGVFGMRLLRDYLTDRADDELVEAVRDTDLGVMVDSLGGRPQVTVQLPSQYRLAFQNASGGTVGVLRSPLRASDEPDWPRMTAAEVARRGPRPFTVPGAGKGDPSWRVIAVDANDLFVGPHTVDTVLVARSLADVEATVHSLVRIQLVVGALVLVGLAAAGYLMVRTALRPLTEIEQTAAAIARGDLSRRIPDQDPRTEVGRLGAALNTMLNQIEGAFRSRAESERTARRSEERMRRFVADASHELRTPLTSIRGFAELHRQGAVTDPAQVQELLGRVEAEATRMGLLVDDLLLLARLDQQRPFDRQPVDLLVVANDAVEAARVREPERDVRLVTPPAAGPGPDPAETLDAPAGATGDAGEAGEAGGSGDAGDVAEAGDGDDVTESDEAAGGVVVAGDEPRLRQVLTNLLDNALVHTPAGTPVTVRVARTERDGHPWAVLEVADRGPGLTPEQRDRVFERFYRTDTARSRARGGTGLGLSIVAAITAAHGGTVEVDSEPGEGATFRVLLPLGA